MKLAEIIVRTDLLIRAIEKTRNEALENESLTMVNILGRKLDVLRASRIEQADRLYAEIGFEAAAAEIEVYRRELDYLYGR
jgi:hypothetical protein